MATEQYNGRPPVTRLIPAGTALHRISGTSSNYPPNSFNRNGIRSLGDPLQGRFEPIDTSHGGYLYVALSLPGAVAEGILRNITIPRSGLIRRTRLVGKTHTVMILERDIEVASLLDGDLQPLNVSGTLVGGDPDRYTWCRSTCHAILHAAPHTDGVIYRCRNNLAEQALMLLDRNALDPSALRVVSSHDVLTDAETFEQIVKVLAEVHHLGYAGDGPTRIF